MPVISSTIDVTGQDGTGYAGANTVITVAPGVVVNTDADHNALDLVGTFQTLVNNGTLNGGSGIDVTGGYAARIVNASAGTISGTDGILLLTSATITNYGLITGSSSGICDAIFYPNSGSPAPASGVKAFVYNFGIISGPTGIYLGTDRDSRVYNYGTINNGVFLHDSGTVVNDGLISVEVGFSKGTNSFSGTGTVDGSIFGGSGNDLFDLSHQVVTGSVYGNGGEDKVSFDTAGAGMTIDLVNGSATGAGEAFSLYGMSDVLGSHYDDNITGTATANVIAAGVGNDTVLGGGGGDTIDGGAGNDVLDGGAGTGDTVSYISAPSGVTVSLALQGHAQNTGGAGTDTLTGFENIDGSDYADVLTGDAGNNIIFGYGGADVIDGGAGNDILYGYGTGTVSYASATAGVTVSLLAQGSGQNTVGSGIDKLYDFEKLIGSNYSDKLFGDASDNVIAGGAGNDIIQGGGGGDTMAGGAGSDRFVYASTTDSSADHPDLIVDFATGSDKIDLTALHLTSTAKITIGNIAGLTSISVDTNNDGIPEMIIEASGTNAVKTSDLITGLPASAVAHSVAAEATPAPVHHDIAATLHAAAVDHGLHG